MVEKKKKGGKNTKNTIAPPPLPVSGCTEIIPRTLIRRGSIITWNKLQSKFTMKVKKKKEERVLSMCGYFFFDKSHFLLDINNKIRLFIYSARVYVRIEFTMEFVSNNFIDKNEGEG